jgi:hypothetical protein
VKFIDIIDAIEEAYGWDGGSLASIFTPEGTIDDERAANVGDPLIVMLVSEFRQAISPMPAPDTNNPAEAAVREAYFNFIISLTER